MPSRTKTKEDEGDPMRIKVFCRVRPSHPGEIDGKNETNAVSLHESTASAAAATAPPGGETTGEVVKTERHPDVAQVAGKNYQFDAVFNATTSNQTIHSTCITPIVQHVMAGYHGAVLCYGQTGTGKTYTMSHQPRSNVSQEVKEESEGILFQGVKEVFREMAAKNREANQVGCRAKFQIKCSFVQLYRDNIQDLLDPATPFLTLRKDQNTAAGSATSQQQQQKDISDVEKVDAMMSAPLPNFDAFLQQYTAGDRHRVVAETKMNKSSSRGHSVLTLHVLQAWPGRSHSHPEGYQAPKELSGRLVFVDLAGYERLSKTMIVDDLRKDEAKHINMSLSSLASVIHSITMKAKHIPWRNSQLCRVLKSTLAGNSITSIILNIGPSSAHLTETVNTLHFGHNAIQCKTQGVKINQTDGNLDYKEEYTRLLASMEVMKVENAKLKLRAAAAEEELHHRLQPAPPIEDSTSTSRPETSASDVVPAWAEQLQVQLLGAERRVERLEETVREQEQQLAEYDQAVDQLDAEVTVWQLKCDALSGGNQVQGGTVTNPQHTGVGGGLNARDMQSQLSQKIEDGGPTLVEDSAEQPVTTYSIPAANPAGPIEVCSAGSFTEPPSPTSTASSSSSSYNSYKSLTISSTVYEPDPKTRLKEVAPPPQTGAAQEEEENNFGTGFVGASPDHTCLSWDGFDAETSFQQWISVLQCISNGGVEGNEQHSAEVIAMAAETTWCSVSDLLQFVHQFCHVMALTESAVVGDSNGSLGSQDPAWRQLQACFAPSRHPFAMPGQPFETLQERTLLLANRLNVFSAQMVPKVCEVQIESGDLGGFQEGDSIRGTYCYVASGDTGLGSQEAATVVRWYRVCQSELPQSGAPSQDGVILVQEGASEYRITHRDVDSYLLFEVTPVNAQGRAGAPVVARTPIPAQSLVPTIRSLKIEGHQFVGQTLSAHYSYSGGDQGPSQIVWYSSIDGIHWTPVVSTFYPNTHLYLTTGFLHHFVRCQVTPVRSQTQEKGTVTVSKLVYINLPAHSEDFVLDSLVKGRVVFENVAIVETNSKAIGSQLQASPSRTRLARSPVAKQQHSQRDGGGEPESGVLGTLTLTLFGGDSATGGQVSFVSSEGDFKHSTTFSSGEEDEGNPDSGFSYPLLFQPHTRPDQVVWCDGRDMQVDRDGTDLRAGGDGFLGLSGGSSRVTLGLRLNSAKQVTVSTPQQQQQQHTDPNNDPEAFERTLVVADQLLLCYRTFFCLHVPSVQRRMHLHVAGQQQETSVIKMLQGAATSKAATESEADEVRTRLISQFQRLRMDVQLQQLNGEGSEATILSSPWPQRPGSYHTVLALFEEALLEHEEVILSPADQVQQQGGAEGAHSSFSPVCHLSRRRNGDMRRLPVLLPAQPGVKF